MESQQQAPQETTCEVESFVGVLTIETLAQVRKDPPTDGILFNDLNQKAVAIATLAPGEKVAVTKLIHMRSLNPLGGFSDTVAEVKLNDGRTGYVPVDFSETRFGSLAEGREAVQDLCREKLRALSADVEGQIFQVSNNADVQANGGLNLRAATSTDSAVLAKLPSGARLMVIPNSEMHQALPSDGFNDDRSIDWIKVNWRDSSGQVVQGWVAKNHLVPQKNS